MQREQNYFQIAIGFGVLVISVYFVFNIYKIRSLVGSGLTKKINLQAKFTNIEGIGIESAVKISGVKIGTVKDIAIDSDDYTARVVINISDTIKIPSDSMLSVSSSGFFGAKFLEIQPGFQNKYMSDNDVFLFTTSSFNVEALLSKFVSSGGTK